ncbi:unnamed protein product [Ilex paraguariensis]|uniref:Uncharacterized protein n=1 Tax=Ilex paraguariensis TaxID=185542 RepID=A0ABC8S1I7_9AQUA
MAVKTTYGSAKSCTANVFEPECTNVRLAWAKTNTLVATITSYFNGEHTIREQKIAFFHDFRNTTRAR